MRPHARGGAARLRRGSGSRRRSAGCGTTPPAGTRRCSRPASGSSAAPTCGSATPCCGGRRSSTRRCSPATTTPGWDALQPVTAGRRTALFPLDDPADRLDPVAEHERQRAALAASAGAGRLGLLLAAESSGALVAAEMTAAGLPWRADVHERLLTELLGPRPAAGQRPAVLERLAGRDPRRAFGAPDLNPDSPGELLRALQARGAAGERHPLLDARAARPPRRPGRCWSTRSWPGCSRPTAGAGWTPGCATAGSGSWFLPGGVVTGRWASNGGGALSVPDAGAPGRGGRRGLAVRRRRRRPARAAGARRHERGRGDGRGGPGDRPLRRAWSPAAPSRPGPRPRSACSARCTAAPAARAAG